MCLTSIPTPWKTKFKFFEFTILLEIWPGGVIFRCSKHFIIFTECQKHCGTEEFGSFAVHLSKQRKKKL